MNFLLTLWLDIRQKAEMRPAPCLLHHDLDNRATYVRDQFTDEFKAIWVDMKSCTRNVLRFVQRFQPGLVTRLNFTRARSRFSMPSTLRLKWKRRCGEGVV